MIATDAETQDAKRPPKFNIFIKLTNLSKKDSFKPYGKAHSSL
jgi:hypothetical protein